METEVGLANSTLKVVASRSFKPITDFFQAKNETLYNEELFTELERHYLELYQTRTISRNVYNLRMRGIRVLREVNETGAFLWKGPPSKNIAALPEHFEHIVAGIASSESGKARNSISQSVIRRFLLHISGLGIGCISQVKAEHVQMFLRDIARTRAKSMDDVVGSLRKLDRYLVNAGGLGLPHAGLLMAPRARGRKIYPHMPADELDAVIRSIDRSMAVGKRDYAMLLLAASSGLRTGDIANFELSDIDWRKNELRIVQSKTKAPVCLPLYKGVGAALVDYIINGRPKSESPQVFLRSLAPFQRFKDGVSIAGILRRRMRAAGVTHIRGDGKTMHGIRRLLGTQMTVEGVPLSTISQVLGQQNPESAKQYISLDIEGMRECALGFDSIREGLE